MGVIGPFRFCTRHVCVSKASCLTERPIQVVSGLITLYLYNININLFNIDILGTRYGETPKGRYWPKLLISASSIIAVRWSHHVDHDDLLYGVMIVRQV